MNNSRRICHTCSLLFRMRLTCTIFNVIPRLTTQSVFAEDYVQNSFLFLAHPTFAESVPAQRRGNLILTNKYCGRFLNSMDGGVGENSPICGELANYRPAARWTDCCMTNQIWNNRPYVQLTNQPVKPAAIRSAPVKRIS